MKNQIFKGTRIGVLLAILFTSMVFMSTSCCKDDPIMIEYELGDTHPDGGIVAYLYQAGDAGYVEGVNQGLAIEYLSDVKWGPTTVRVGNTTDGDGEINTDLIISTLDALGETNYAAKNCRALGPDWYLPSQLELIWVLKNLGASPKYWSSWEATGSTNTSEAVGVSYNGASPLITVDTKSDELPVIAVRKF